MSPQPCQQFFSNPASFFLLSKLRVSSYSCKHYLSLHMRKLTICICENKDTDQLCSNCTADQCLCFHHTDNTIPLLLVYPKFQASSFILWLYSLVCVGPVPKLLVFSHTGSIICMCFNIPAAFQLFFSHDGTATASCVLTSTRMSWAASWENRIFAYAKTKVQISFAVTAKLISAFVFATRIVQFLFFLNPKFQAASPCL